MKRTIFVLWALAIGVAQPVSAQCDPQEIQKLLAADGAADDEFGISVSISGDPGNEVAIVGAFFDDDDGSFSGSAYIYRFNGSSWIQEQKLTASDGRAGDEFGFSVSMSGDPGNEVAIVGAEGHSDNGSSSGSAYIYRFNGSSWIEEQKLLASDGDTFDSFGHSVAISGGPGNEVAIVGATGDDDNGRFSGSAYIYRFNGSSWIEEQKLTASDGAEDDHFGRAVSIGGGPGNEVAIVGAMWDDDRAGSAYIYRFNGSSWIEEQKLLAEDGAANDRFGRSVSIISGPGNEVAIVGAFFDDDNGTNSGSAYIYRFNGSLWVEEQKLTASDGDAFDQFGNSVSMSGSVAIVGANRDDNNVPASASGSAYIYRFDGSLWVEEEKLTASDGAANDHFGASVAISGAPGNEVAIVGAVLDDDNGDESGSAYIFELNCFSGTPATLTSFTVLDGTLISGGLPELASSDDMYLETEAKVTGEAAETHRLLMRVRAITAVQNPGTIDITLEAHITDIEAIVTLFLKNFQTGQFEQVGQFTNGMGVDTTNTVNIPNAARFVRPNGRIVLRVKKIVILPFTLNGFHSLEDLLEIRVR